MWTKTALLALSLVAGSVSAHAGPVDHRSAAILERFKSANQWRDHVMVVAHRGGVRENGRIVRAENSSAAVNAAIELGAEMVEIDVQKTRDGVYIALHDSWLDRTTTCTGRLIERDLKGLEPCRLRLDGTNEPLSEGIPTLRDILLTARDRILVNIDNKLEPGDLVGIVAVARELGMEGQLVIKQNLWNAAKIREAEALRTEIGDKVLFMPIIADDAVQDAGFMETATKAVKADAAEIINWRRSAGDVTAKGGALFDPRSRAVSVRGDWHMWVNTYTIVNKPAGYLSGGRGDELAVLASNPDDVFGFWIDRGATIIQTDEPKAAIEWLTANGYRVPYDLTN